MIKPQNFMREIKDLPNRILHELKPENRKTLIRRMVRYFRLKYLRLLRTPGGGRSVALGFAYGFALEIILPITAYTGYVFMLPLLRYPNILSAAIIGNALAKITFLPLLLIPFGNRLGHHLLFHFIHHIFRNEIVHDALSYFASVIGVSVCASVIGLIVYCVVYFVYSNNNIVRKRT